MPGDKLTAEVLGFDLSTTALAAGVRSATGKEDFVSIQMRGAERWRGQPAFNLAELPGLLIDVLKKLEERGWAFSFPGALSFSVRQHDMVIISHRRLMPALSWQCNVASAEVAELQKLGAEKIVGKIEERFILPKLKWVLKQEMKESLSFFCLVDKVMTTGDYIAFMLTGRAALSTSDALSNGLLNQQTKELARDVLERAEFKLSWFPEVIQSGQVIGSVSQNEGILGSWRPVIEILKGWQVVAGLGDNHAGGVGCGLSDFETIVISAGSSGTVIRKCRPDLKLRGRAACFEYYGDRLLLMMLADCAVWYDRFVGQFGEGKKLSELDELALRADLAKIRRIFQEWDGKGWQEMYPENWGTLTLAEKVASTQASIAVRLLLLVREMLEEAPGAPEIKRFILTGGMSQSRFFQNIFAVGLSILVEDAEVLVSNRQGLLANQSAALGAMINAMVGVGKYPNLSSATAELCPLKPAACPNQQEENLLRDFISRGLFD